MFVQWAELKICRKAGIVTGFITEGHLECYYPLMGTVRQGEKYNGR